MEVKWSDFHGGTEIEVRAAFEGDIAYYGRYTVDEAHSTVTHLVKNLGTKVLIK